MGYPGNPQHEEVKKAIRKIKKTARDVGIATNSTASTNKEAMVESQKNGSLLFTVNPAAFIADSCKQLLSGIKDTLID